MVEFMCKMIWGENERDCLKCYWEERFVLNDIGDICNFWVKYWDYLYIDWLYKYG